MEDHGESSVVPLAGEEVVEDMIGRLNLHEEEAKDVAWEDAAPDQGEKTK
jgi:hypothetical protein